MGQLGNAVHSHRTRFGDVAVVLFLIAQAVDGVLTYVGVNQFGSKMEANPLLAWMIGTLGCGVALTGAKAVASAFGIVLHLSAVHRVVAALVVFYLAVAIVPWVALLLIG